MTLTFDLESGVRVTRDVGYLYANFGLPRPLCSRLRPDVRDRRQIDRRQTKASLNAPLLGAGHNNAVLDRLCISSLTVHKSRLNWVSRHQKCT